MRPVGVAGPALLLVALTLVLASMPAWLHLPLPDNGLVLTQAALVVDDGPVQAVTLPDTVRTPEPGRSVVRYAMTFELPAQPEQAQTVYIPAARHQLSVAVNGLVVQLPADSPWLQQAQGYTSLLRVPADYLLQGENHIVVTLRRSDAAIPFYLSPVYIERGAGLDRSPWLALAMAGQGRIAAFVLHLVVLLGLLTLWTARRHDPLFRWLALIGSTTLLATVLDIAQVLEGLASWAPAQHVLMCAFGLMALGVALSAAERPTPRWLVPTMCVLPVLLLGLGLLVGERPLLVTGISASIAIGGHIVATVLLAANFLRTGRWDQGLLAVPFFLVAWIGLGDMMVVTGLREAPFLLTNYVRPLTMLTIVVVLMRRLANSLNSLDEANDLLRNKLAEQERQLSSLHARERQRAAEAVLEDERGRLTRDLHDGLSGHLVSIIALSERGADPATIERSARAALDDLRLVINSLDVGDEDLPLALAGFRERLEPQLRRLGVGLDWSMEKLPEIGGVTPGNALSVLRIMQEAVTNALKHGPARHIRIEGRRGYGGAAVIAVANDGGGSEAARAGHGLSNMSRRARSIGGDAVFERLEGEAIMRLTLPPRLLDA
ncbi:sensor histidine kinase [Devosia ginsengisoli]|uniref:Two-component sensor histidine kinase n=1 Tax=Devosia ginsengisoli TaxID=400770 RepID=A0A5B8LY05_9HYPH|nr:ATP-binding protein [Devosia ginsengisoli]QDZ12290.1 two-component sensor histidine kinase [Devosia ginsengisoli]